MVRFHATWILPISGPPIRDDWVAIEGGRVVACGAGSDRRADEGVREVDLGEVAIMPGLVNTHTHLELSYLRDRVPPAPAFVTWIRAVLAAPGRRLDPGAPYVLESIARGLVESVACGKAVVGDS